MWPIKSKAIYSSTLCKRSIPPADLKPPRTLSFGAYMGSGGPPIPVCLAGGRDAGRAALSWPRRAPWGEKGARAWARLTV